MSSPSNKKLIVHLYRSFYRTARKFDENAAAKALLYRKNVNTTAMSAGEVYYKEVIDAILFKGKLFNPINCFMPLTDLVNSEFRRKHDVLLNERIDVSFTLLRAFTSVWSTYMECLKDVRLVEEYTPFIHDNSDNKNIHAPSSSAVESAESLYDIPVRLTTSIATGTMLVAHPLVQGHKHRAVVLVLESNSNGAYGLIINMPTEKTLAEATRNIPSPILAEFGKTPVRFGGATRRLQFLHPFDNIGGSKIVDSEKWHFGGNVLQAIDIVKGNPEAKKQFTFYAGCCFWTTKHLDHEVQQGYWIPVIASPNSAMLITEASRKYAAAQREASRERTASTGHGQGQEMGAVEGAHSSTATAKDSSVTASMKPPQELWRTLLKGLGSDFSTIASLPAWLDLSKVKSVDWR